MGQLEFFEPDPRFCSVQLFPTIYLHVMVYIWNSQRHSKDILDVKFNSLYSHVLFREHVDEVRISEVMTKLTHYTAGTFTIVLRRILLFGMSCSALYMEIPYITGKM